MEKVSIEDLPWRERQVMDVVYRLNEATATQIQEQLEEPPSNSAIRAMLSRLEEKGVLTHREDGQRYLYKAVQAKKKVADSALKKLVGVFFNDSPTSAATALLGMSGKLSAQEIDQLQALIDKAKQEGR
ncbi:BlaI/MecI/CopY family transcriptional regulator [Rhodoferax sp. AJA081-3]|uniref:BlaI/MecI/CopY family transcriptional regulator n=1 Tax=Rhodoferax sp. AJA081-3 TaxID=2752316 RepID=UPI001AE01320|nr:BlaI/MecI/CopY family transcriptional regulator [Rhodoferax sp. AJA081-3]QTN28006.1 BlaI/MecI/CopY family transcriptional regulator [Rhodoferax sp. AJA081-3]